MGKTPDAKVITIAGSEESGFADDTGPKAKFWNPSDIAVDSDGNCYVADTDNHRIRQIDPEGKVTTLVGTEEGFMDGPSDVACFSKPEGIAIGPDGDLYVADSENNRIRKITLQSGKIEVTTIAGRGIQGFADKPKTSAQFYNPSKLAVDRSGNIFVADTCNARIRKITDDGAVSTIASHPESASETFTPPGIAMDPKGDIYFSDSANHRICTLRRTDKGFSFSVLTGSKDFALNDDLEQISCVDGVGSKARFKAPHGLACDSEGNIYVADYWNHRIRMISLKNGEVKVTTLAGGEEGFADGKAKTARFSYPMGVAVDSKGDVYVADTYNNRIRKILR